MRSTGRTPISMREKTNRSMPYLRFDETSNSRICKVLIEVFYMMLGSLVEKRPSIWGILYRFTSTICQAFRSRIVGKIFSPFCVGLLLKCRMLLLGFSVLLLLSFSKNRHRIILCVVIILHLEELLIIFFFGNYQIRLLFVYEKAVRKLCVQTVA